ncbi:MAG: IclR family transcriptional regulator domain-containing protein, partial [Thermocrispum sp.]
MEELLRRFNETVMLGSVVGETLVYLHSVESTQLVRYSPPRVRPPSQHPSSIGKLYLAELDDDALHDYVATSIAPELRERLLDEVRQARGSGVAFNHGDTFADLSAVAARIVADRRIVACLAIGGPTRRIDARLDEMVTATRRAADAIGQSLVSSG